MKNTMKIEGRVVNTKGHTLGYKINGRHVTTEKAVTYAENGRLKNVIVSSLNGRKYIMSRPGAKSLSQYPSKHVSTVRGNVFGK